MVEIDNSVRLRMVSMMNAKLHAMTLFCQSERCKGSCQCGYTLKCCEYNPNKPTCPHRECQEMLSNILLCDIGDIISFGCTPRSGTPEDILKEAMRRRESAALDKEGTHPQTDSNID
ncbi:hypothetical protein [Bacteroides sp.]